MSGDQGGVGCCQGFSAQEVLLDPAQPGTPERRHIASNQGLEARVGRLRYQYGADRCRDILGSRSVSLAWVK